MGKALGAPGRYGTGYRYPVGKAVSSNRLAVFVQLLFSASSQRREARNALPEHRVARCWSGCSRSLLRQGRQRLGRPAAQTLAAVRYRNENFLRIFGEEDP